MEALTSLVHEDAVQSMPPFDMWLSGRDDIFAWARSRGSGAAARESFRPSPRTARLPSGSTTSDSGSGYDPWALQVLEVADGKIVELTFFLDTPTLFPLFGLPPVSTRSTSARPMNSISSISSGDACRRSNREPWRLSATASPRARRSSRRSAGHR